MKQPIHKVINEMFEYFAESNQGWLNKLEYDTVTDLKDVGAFGDLDIMREPVAVRYIGKVEGDIGPYYMFLDKDFDKVYEFFGGDLKAYIDSL